MIYTRSSDRVRHRNSYEPPSRDMYRPDTASYALAADIALHAETMPNPNALIYMIRRNIGTRRT